MTLAVVTPMNSFAAAALRDRSNRFIIHKASKTGVRMPRSRQAIVLKLDAALLASREFICFGSARAMEVRLPRTDPGIQAQHFYIKVDFTQKALIVADVSKQGIFYADRGGSFHHLCKASIRVVDDVRIRLGSDDRRMEFLIQPSASLNARRSRRQSQQRRSIDLSRP